MADRNVADKQLDEAIDRAVRDMTHVEPTGDLRQRVLDEIGAPQWVMPWRVLASASAALAAIVLLVNLITRQPAPPESRVASTRAVSPIQQTTPPPATKPSTPGTAQARPPATSPIAQRPRRSTPLAPHTAQDRLVEAASIPGALALETSTAPAEPLAPVLPVAMTLLETPLIRTSEIEITQITLERIEIVPLPSRR
jgi:hypothetical protein